MIAMYKIARLQIVYKLEYIIAHTKSLTESQLKLSNKLY